MSVQSRTRKSGRVAYYSVIRWRGRAVWISVGHNHRVASARDAQYQAQADAGTFDPDASQKKAPTVEEFARPWLLKRKNRTADKDRAMFRLHVLPHSIAKLRVMAVMPRHIEQLVEELRAKGLSDKSVSNVLGTLRVMFGDAKRSEVTFTQPVDLPKKHLNRRRKTEPEIYQPTECRVLMRNQTIDPRARMLWALLFFTGMRAGEAVGRRWRDAQDAEGLKALHIGDQYGGEPLKTDQPRVCPIHPELAEILTLWVGTWESITGRAPEPTDYIVPGTVKPHLTRSQAFKMLRASCEAVNIRWRSFHSTRHTFITLAKRGGARQDLVEKITHNARGGIVDGYTRQDWQPLCSVVGCLDFDTRQRIALPTESLGENRPISAFLPKA